MYSQLAHDVLAGKKIDVGLFGELELPSVPDNVALVTMAGPLTTCFALLRSNTVMFTIDELIEELEDRFTKLYNDDIERLEEITRRFRKRAKPDESLIRIMKMEIIEKVIDQFSLIELEQRLVS